MKKQAFRRILPWADSAEVLTRDIFPIATGAMAACYLLPSRAQVGYSTGGEHCKLPAASLHLQNATPVNSRTLHLLPFERQVDRNLRDGNVLVCGKAKLNRIPLLLNSALLQLAMSTCILVNAMPADIVCAPSSGDSHRGWRWNLGVSRLLLPGVCYDDCPWLGCW